MNAKQPVNNSRNNTSDGVKKTARSVSVKSVKVASGKSKPPSRPPHTGVIIKRGL